MSLPAIEEALAISFDFGFGPSAEFRIEGGEQVAESSELRDGLDIEVDGCGYHGAPAIDFHHMVTAGGGQAGKLHANGSRRNGSPNYGHKDVAAPVEEQVLGAEGLHKEVGSVDEIVGSGFLAIALLKGLKHGEPEQSDVTLVVAPEDRTKKFPGLRRTRQAGRPLAVIPFADFRGHALDGRVLKGMGFFHQLLFDEGGVMEGEAKADGVEQILLAARLGEKAEDIAFVDGGDGGVEVGEAGENILPCPARISRPGHKNCAAFMPGMRMSETTTAKGLFPWPRAASSAAVGGIGYEPVAQYSSEGVKDEGSSSTKRILRR